MKKQNCMSTGISETKKQSDGFEHRVRKITKIGKERLKHFNKKKGPDEGLAPLLGVDASMSEEGLSPEEGFSLIENLQAHETGGILGVRGIVYEPINEQGLILLYAALCHGLGFMIEAIRSAFLYALLRRRNPNRVLKNKNQAVRQGARRSDKRSIFSICEHWRESCNAEWRPQAQFFISLLRELGIVAGLNLSSSLPPSNPKSMIRNCAIESYPGSTTARLSQASDMLEGKSEGVQIRRRKTAENICLPDNGKEPATQRRRLFKKVLLRKSKNSTNRRSDASQSRAGGFAGTVSV
ncbi:MAG TPA: hypothetical protein PKV75_05830 [Desulfobacterales bacterium]|nr:hypothetical protein [Desulfobacterales bacterium]